MTKQTNSGIKAGDQVLVYLENYYDQRGVAVGIRFAEVERVTPTQAIIEGIRYHADPYNDRRGKPAKAEDREYVENETPRTSGRRMFAHPAIVDPVVWDHLIARKDRPEALERAKAINSRAYGIFGYEHHMNLAQLLKLSQDERLMTSYELMMDRTERIRQEALDAGAAFFARYAPAKEDQ